MGTTEGKRTRGARPGLPGCLLTLLGAPLLGFLVTELHDIGWGAVAAAGAVALGLAWTALDLLRASRAAPPGTTTVTWSFAPVSAGVIAATDVVALSGDLTPATWLLIALPCAVLGSGVVFVAELRESRRALYSIVKAGVALVLIALPLPVGGLVGAGASLGHRMLREPSNG